MVNSMAGRGGAIARGTSGKATPVGGGARARAACESDGRRTAAAIVGAARGTVIGERAGGGGGQCAPQRRAHMCGGRGVATCPLQTKNRGFC